MTTIQILHRTDRAAAARLSDLVSSMPAVDEFDYSFDHFAVIVEKLIERLKIERYSL